MPAIVPRKNTSTSGLATPLDHRGRQRRSRFDNGVGTSAGVRIGLLVFERCSSLTSHDVGCGLWSLLRPGTMNRVPCFCPLCSCAVCVLSRKKGAQHLRQGQEDTGDARLVSSHTAGDSPRWRAEIRGSNAWRQHMPHIDGETHPNFVRLEQAPQGRPAVEVGGDRQVRWRRDLIRLNATGVIPRYRAMSFCATRAGSCGVRSRSRS
jgi:hypothetical protein